MDVLMIILKMILYKEDHPYRIVSLSDDVAFRLYKPLP